MTVAKKNAPTPYSLSIIIPVFNEEKTIGPILEKIKALQLTRPFELVIVNDGSGDSTHFVIRKFIKENPQLAITYIHQENQGKGGAVKSGLMAAKNDVILIQDADLEYDPQDYGSLLAPIDAGAAVVYGSRNLNRHSPRPHSSTFFYWGGIFLTVITNILYGSKLTDEATGYKVFHKRLLQKLDFQRRDFGWEPEFTAKILKRHIPITEVPISYQPRKVEDGKKITWQDGLIAVWILLYERFKF